MALTELLTALESEAAAEAARLEADARAEARVIVEAARTEADTFRERAARAGEDERTQFLAHRRATARLAAAAGLRETREELFRTLLTAVRARLAELREDDVYPGLLRQAIQESLSALPAATGLRVDPRDEGLAIASLEHLGVQLPVFAILETAGGVEVVSDDGRSVRNTLEERFSNAEPALRLLFGEALAEDAPSPHETAAHAA